MSRPNPSAVQTTRLLGALLALCAFALPAAAQTEEQLPDAQTIISKYVEALGGAEALEKTRTVKISGTMELPQGAEATFESYYGKDRFYRKMELPGGAIYEQGYNGETAWEKNPSPGLGNRKLQGTEQEDFVRRMNHLDMLTWGEDFAGEIRTKSQGISVRGVECCEVEFVPTSGNKVSRFFAQDTGLLIKMATILDTPNGGVAVDIFYSDYKDFQGTKMAMKRSQEVNGTQISFVFGEVEVLDAFPEALEVVPDDVG